ncbi:uncharacterized protein TNCV_2619501 [Trichonephila clavipes]|uniref:DUF5641 domain-containing protein n=1 Tax=Trichonephila clavipes TaxID=2585209 RepID=A0A8X7BMI8_TRICX|nr:uncharacterized protein TNCV_2619501 [Trichonephila clavipes]
MRGKCSKMFTDNATNFVGSNSQLKVFYKTLNFPDQNLAAYYTEEGFEWNFIPPRAPHMGGLWEAGIKSVKYHLKRALGRSRLTYEEFKTVIIQVEGILNSRTLTQIFNDFDNFERGKWMIEKDNVMCGTMVIVKEDFTPVCNWLLGRVVEIYHGSDGKERNESTDGNDCNNSVLPTRVRIYTHDNGGQHRYIESFNANFRAQRESVLAHTIRRKRTAEVSELVNKRRPLINWVVNKSVENATSCDFEKENCDPQDKGVANPEGLICENICKEKYTIGTLMGCEKQLTMNRESLRNHTIAKIAGQLNEGKESMCKADVRKDLEDGLTIRLPLSEPREIYKDKLETDNRSNIGSEFNFEIDLPGKRYRSTIYRLNLIKLYRRKPELANLVMENSSEGIDSETLYSVKLFMDFGFQGNLRKSQLYFKLPPDRSSYLRMINAKKKERFLPEPGTIVLRQKDINLVTGKPFRGIKTCCSSQMLINSLREDTEYLLDLGVNGMGQSNRTLPVVWLGRVNRYPYPRIKCIKYRNLNQQIDVSRMVDTDILIQIWKNRVKKIDFVLKWLSRVGSEVGPTKVLCEGDTKNRWRDGQVCPDVRQGTMTPWARRLGGEEEEKSGENGRKEKTGDGTERERGDRKRKETGSGRERAEPALNGKKG